MISPQNQPKSAGIIAVIKSVLAISGMTAGQGKLGAKQAQVS